MRYYYCTLSIIVCFFVSFIVLIELLILAQRLLQSIADSLFYLLFAEATLNKIFHNNGKWKFLCVDSTFKHHEVVFNDVNEY